VADLMRRILHNIHVGVRRAMVWLIMLVPASLRARLARSSWLERIYVWFDDARYEPILAAGEYDDWTSGQRTFINAQPLHAWRFRPPVLGQAHITRMASFERQPLVSILLPVYNALPLWLERALESVYSQWYENWEVCLVDDHSSSPETMACIARINHPRVRVRRLEANGNIVAASNAALAMAAGEFVALLDHDDELAADALFRVVDRINRKDADFIYSDEDKLDARGRHVVPHFKPDLAPENLLSQNYISHLAVIRRALVETVGGFTAGMDGAQDYDLYLKVLEHTDRVAHVPRVLYHWRQSAGSTAHRFDDKDYARTVGRKALEAAVQRRGLDARVEPGLHEGTYRVRYELAGTPLVSIIIPFRDRPELLDLCLGSLLAQTTYEHFEVIGVDNHSERGATREAMQRWSQADSRIRFERHDAPFNYSAINNEAVRRHARGEHIVMLNNDIEIITPDWLECLLEHSQRPEIGAVGAKLYYPGGRIQHAGCIIGLGGVAGHSHKHVKGSSPGYFARLRIVQNVGAVTAACLMVKKQLYEAVGGLNAEQLAVAFNDVDFCMRLNERGYRNVFTPYCEAVHHESKSRGFEDTQDKRERFEKEVLYFQQRHAGALERGDPYYNPNLTLDREDFSLKVTLEQDP
jgi:glycosyltransferase involved in cell wall biosynthesis